MKGDQPLSYMYKSTVWSCQLNSRVIKWRAWSKKRNISGKNWKLPTSFRKKSGIPRSSYKRRCKRRSNNVGRRGSLVCDKTRGSAIFVCEYLDDLRTWLSTIRGSDFSRFVIAIHRKREFHFFYTFEVSEIVGKKWWPVRFLSWIPRAR